MENSYFQFLPKWGGDCAPGSDGPETVAVEFKQELLCVLHRKVALAGSLV